MKTAKHTKKIFLAVALGLFVVTGTYNAIIINSESHLTSSDVKFVKRLDEVYGVTIAGREVAASMSWQKLSPHRIATKKMLPNIAAVSSTSSPTAMPSEEIVPSAAVQEELELSLVEVINPKKWQQGLAATQFDGSLSTNNGVIESLSVSLPNDEGVSVSFSEMTGNVFEYDLNGELYSGMMYQVDEKSYMVTLTNGPLEGTRLRFSASAPAEEQAQAQETLAENNIEVGNFGQEQGVEQPVTAQAEEVSPEQLMERDQNIQQESMQVQGFNMESAQAM
jgi:hypothetical protein